MDGRTAAARAAVTVAVASFVRGQLGAHPNAVVTGAARGCLLALLPVSLCGGWTLSGLVWAALCGFAVAFSDAAGILAPADGCGSPAAGHEADLVRFWADLVDLVDSFAGPPATADGSAAFQWSSVISCVLGFASVVALTRVAAAPADAAAAAAAEPTAAEAEPAAAATASSGAQEAECEPTSPAAERSKRTEAVRTAIAFALPAAARLSQHAPDVGSCSEALAHNTAQWQWSMSGARRVDCVDYAPALFEAVRSAVGLDTAAYASLCSEPPTPVGQTAGRSGASLYTSRRRGVLFKTVTAGEREVLLQLLPAYEKHLRSHCTGTFLQRVVGMYQLQSREGGSCAKLSFLSILDVFTRPHTLKFDLKGSSYNRSGVGSVRKDNDWRKRYCIELPSEQARQKLMDDLTADVAFLEQQGVMDYSLLVGFDDEPRSGAAAVSDGLPPGGRCVTDVHGTCYELGIIDMLQQYTTEKKVERLAKSVATGIHTISSQNPQRYKARFLEFCRTEVFTVGGAQNDGD